eukprot:TRINITY_DN58232_c0_g1_i1.p1 TRINITY_DN58232_c0_g1~~TRINITY_DN58232_c0_g1_i1.p1  ORF type:complete len:342 (+),score=88.40 TRINITY_DN58232_c0_g1_i1:101-1027(+)
MGGEEGMCGAPRLHRARSAPYLGTGCDGWFSQGADYAEAPTGANHYYQPHQPHQQQQLQSQRVEQCEGPYVTGSLWVPERNNLSDFCDDSAYPLPFESSASSDAGAGSTCPPRLLCYAVQPIKGFGTGWWGRQLTPNSLAWHQERAHTNRKNSRRKKDKARRSDPTVCKAKHARKVQKAIQQKAPCYTSQQIIALCQEGMLSYKGVSEIVHDYVVYTLPTRGIITCPRSGLEKLSCGVCVRRDLIRAPAPSHLLNCPKLEGPSIISTREYKNVSKRDPPCIDETVLKYISQAEREGAQLRNSAEGAGL